MSVINTVFQAVACTASEKNNVNGIRDNFYLDGKSNSKLDIENVTEMSAALTEGLFAVFDCSDSYDTRSMLNSAVKILENFRDKIVNGGHDDVNDFVSELDREYKNSSLKNTKQYASMSMIRIKDSKAQVFNIGGCRAYIYRSGSFNKITRDNTVADELVRVNALTPNEAKKDPRRFELTRYIGNPSPDAKTVVNYTPEFDFGGNDIFLLCTDGVFESIGERSIAYIMSKTDNPKSIACSIINSAVENGCKDDVTVVVLKPVDKKPSNRPLGKNLYNNDTQKSKKALFEEVTIDVSSESVSELNVKDYPPFEKDLYSEAPEKYNVPEEIVENKEQFSEQPVDEKTQISDSSDDDYVIDNEDYELEDISSQNVLRSIISNDFFSMPMLKWGILAGLSALLGIVIALIVLNFV